MSAWQESIVESVQARGYVQGPLSSDEFAFTQAMKLVEEVAEYINTFHTETIVGRDPMPMTRLDFLMAHLNSACEDANALFDIQRELLTVTRSPRRPLSIDYPKAGKELGDVLVTVAMSAHALGVDVEEIARGKAKGDVARGVR